MARLLPGRAPPGPAADPTGGFGALTAQAVSGPKEIAAIRTLGNSDQEYLLMGAMAPSEIRIREQCSAGWYVGFPEGVLSTPNSYYYLIIIQLTSGNSRREPCR